MTEQTVTSQGDLLRILLDLDDMRVQSKHCVPLLLDMDIHYRVLKMMYGPSLMNFRMREKFLSYPIVYGIFTGNTSPSAFGCIDIIAFFVGIYLYDLSENLTGVGQLTCMCVYTCNRQTHEACR